VTERAAHKGNQVAGTARIMKKNKPIINAIVFDDEGSSVANAAIAIAKKLAVIRATMAPIRSNKMIVINLLLFMVMKYPDQINILSAR
jgi:cysteine synthase